MTPHVVADRYEARYAAAHILPTVRRATLTGLKLQSLRETFRGGIVQADGHPASFVLAATKPSPQRALEAVHTFAKGLISMDVKARVYCCSMVDLNRSVREFYEGNSPSMDDVATRCGDGFLCIYDLDRTVDFPWSQIGEAQRWLVRHLYSGGALVTSRTHAEPFPIDPELDTLLHNAANLVQVD